MGHALSGKGGELEQEQNQNTTLKISVESAGVLNFASAVNSVPVIQRIELHNATDKDLEDVSLLIDASPALIREKTIHVSKVPAGHNFVLEPVGNPPIFHRRQK